MPLRSVLGVCHWQTAPEAAAETAALRRRGLRGAAGKRPALEFGGDKEKFLVKFFSKNLWGLGAATSRWDVAQRPTEAAAEKRVVGRSLPVANALRRPSRQARPEAPAFPYFQKRGTDVPLLGCLRARSRGYRLRRVRPVRCFFSTGCAGF